ncbi:uncharacterized protein [Typha angustifolia]|uniref:uncharacterized protein n=1 Tax=Typha angustifolia TaxID=59011 RepID=UPI003C30D3AF
MALPRVPAKHNASGDHTAPSSSSSSDDDSDSFPSLPSLQTLTVIPIPSSSSSSSSSSLTSSSYAASFLHLTSFKPHLPSSTAAAALAASPSSLLLYSATPTSLSIYDLNTQTPLEALPAVPRAGSVKSLVILPSGDDRIITAHQDGLLRLWRRSPRSGLHSLAGTLPTLSDRLRRLPFPSSYVPIRRHHRRLWVSHFDAVSAIAANGGLIYSVSWDKTLKIWRSSDLRCLESVTAHDDAVNAVAVAPDGTVYTGSADRRIRVWARAEGSPRHVLVATLDRHRSSVNALAINGSGSILYSGANDRSILVWEREESADHVVVVGSLRGHRKAVLCLACVKDLVLSGSSDRTVRIWRRGRERRDYMCLGVMDGHVSGVRSIVAVWISPEKKKSHSDEEVHKVCSGSLDGEVRVWEVRVSGLRRSD